MRARLGSWLLLVVLVATWEFYCRAAGVPSLIVPLPSAVFHTLWAGLTSGFLLPHIWVTSVEIVLGLVAGCGVVRSEPSRVRGKAQPPASCADRIRPQCLPCPSSGR